MDYSNVSIDFQIVRGGDSIRFVVVADVSDSMKICVSLDFIFLSDQEISNEKQLIDRIESENWSKQSVRGLNTICHRAVN